MTFQREIIEIKGLSEIERLKSDDEDKASSFDGEDNHQSTCHSSLDIRRRRSPLTLSTTSFTNHDTSDNHIRCLATTRIPSPTSNQKHVDNIPKTTSTIAGVSLNTITFCLPSVPCLLANESKSSDHTKTSCKPVNQYTDCLKTGTPSVTTSVNAIVTSSSESKSPSTTKSLCSTEFAELLKSCKITIKPVEKTQNKKASCKSQYTSARWRYLTNQTRNKPHRLKWHHTNFDDKSKKSRKSMPKSVLSDTTPLAQAWLEQATRDRATAETLRTVENHECTPISPSSDPCLVSTSYLSDGETELPDIDASNPAEACDDSRSRESELLHKPEVPFDDESCESRIRDLREQCQRYRKPLDEHEKDASDTKQWKKHSISADLVDAKEPNVPQKASQDRTTKSFKMQGELSCFSPQQPESFQSDPKIWNSFSSNAAPAPDSLLVDLFGGSSELFNVDSVNDIIMDDNFSLFDIEGNTFMDYSATSTQEKPLVAQHTDLTVPSEPSVTSHTATSICSLPSISYPSPNPLQPVYKSVVRSSSFDHPGCPPEELLCTSDTDSGIHSPEASKSPRDDVYNWKTDLNSHGTEVFFHHPVTSQSTIDSEEMNSVGLSSGIQEPQLLNMDDHRRYNAVPLKAIFSRDNSSRDNEVRSPRAEELKLECSTNTEEWSTLLSVDKSVTSGNFQISYAPPSPTTSTATMRRPKKVSKRRLYSGKSRKSSERGKSSPHLWEFIRDILLNPKHTPSLIKWEDRETGVFRFVQSDTVAAMWGEEKNNTKMTYEKLSRAMRYYYNRGILERVDGRRLVYKFGPNAHGWKTGSKLSSKSADSGLKESTNSNTCATSVEVLKSTDISSLCFSYKTSSIDTLALHCKSSSSSLPSANVLLGRSIRLASA